MSVSPRNTVARFAFAAFALIGALAPAALAGPDIDEATSSRPDAGATPASARHPWLKG